MNPVWSAVEIGGKRADVFEPPGSVRHALIFLHPYGLETLIHRPAFAGFLAARGLACVSPHGRRSWWADRICAEFDPERTSAGHILDFVEPWCRQRWGDRTVGLFGISMGGQGALRLGFEHPERFPAVAGVASAIDYFQWYGQGEPLDAMYADREDCRLDSATLRVRPDRAPPSIHFACDPADVEWFRGNDRLHEKLSASGVEHSCDLDTHVDGHGWGYFERAGEQAIDFVATALDRQGRRLL